VIDGTNNKVITNNIKVGSHPFSIAVNPNTNLIYVANSGSNTVSVIDESLREVVAGLTFKVIPLNSGHIICNGREYATDTYSRIPYNSNCRAQPNTGFQFSSWTEYLGHNSSLTITKSPTSIISYFINLISPDTNSNLGITKYGNYVANFTPSPIPEGVWITLVGIMLGTFIPSIFRWLNGWRQRRNMFKHLKEIELNYENLDKDARKRKITESYVKGKINESQFKILDEKISEYYKN
jgi:YVTN family beta-propeller protein